MSCPEYSIVECKELRIWRRRRMVSQNVNDIICNDAPSFPISGLNSTCSEASSPRWSTWPRQRRRGSRRRRRRRRRRQQQRPTWAAASAFFSPRAPDFSWAWRRMQARTKRMSPPPSCLKFLTVLDLKSMFAKCDKHYPSRSGQTTSLATAITNFTKPATMINFGPSNIDQNFCQVRKIEA